MNLDLSLTARQYGQKGVELDKRSAAAMASVKMSENGRISGAGGISSV